MNIELTKELASILKEARARRHCIRTFKRRRRPVQAYVFSPNGSWTHIESHFAELLKFKLIFKPSLERIRNYELYALTDLGKSIVIPDMEFLPGSPLDFS